VSESLQDIPELLRDAFIHNFIDKWPESYLNRSDIIFSILYEKEGGRMFWTLEDEDEDTEDW
jgi:hypothetical protein